MILMAKPGEQLPQRVVILRALHLGDLMCSVPAFRALRAALPEAHISLVGLPSASSFVERFNHYLDEFIEFPGYPGLPEQEPMISQVPHFLNEIQRRKFDLAMQLQGSGAITNSLTVLFGAERNAGFFLQGQYCPDESLFALYPVHEPEIRRILRLMEFLGATLQGDNLEFPLFPKDWDDFHKLTQDVELRPGRYACVHPGARAIERRWPVESFAVVADGLVERGLQVVLTGTKAEAELIAAVAARMKYPALNWTGRTSLGCLGVLLSRARLLVSNDTGVSHLAAALSLPSVILFTATDPERWAPLDRIKHRAIAWATAATPQSVLDEADELLQMERVYAD